MDLLTSLGVNSTLAVQFGLFLVTYFALKDILFRPYFEAYNERNERTVGKAEQAERFVAETRELEEKFAIRAREVNERYKLVYDRSRNEALKEYDRLVTEARQRAKEMTDGSRGKIQLEMQEARSHLGQEVTGVAQLINRQLIGKDLST
jgi:F0F1-type ATP synthase membrane subunit b/b'